MSNKQCRPETKSKVRIETTSSKIFVSVPPAMHVALEAEAVKEGVTLNELVIAKLAMSVSKKSQA